MNMYRNGHIKLNKVSVVRCGVGISKCCVTLQCRGGEGRGQNVTSAILPVGTEPSSTQ